MAGADRSSANMKSLCVLFLFAIVRTAGIRVCRLADRAANYKLFEEMKCRCASFSSPERLFASLDGKHMLQ